MPRGSPHTPSYTTSLDVDSSILASEEATERRPLQRIASTRAVSQEITDYLEAILTLEVTAPPDSSRLQHAVNSRRGHTHNCPTPKRIARDRRERRGHLLESHLLRQLI